MKRFVVLGLSILAALSFSKMNTALAYGNGPELEILQYFCDPNNDLLKTGSIAEYIKDNGVLPAVVILNKNNELSRFYLNQAFGTPSGGIYYFLNDKWYHKSNALLEQGLPDYQVKLIVNECKIVDPPPPCTSNYSVMYETSDAEEVQYCFYFDTKNLS